MPLVPTTQCRKLQSLQNRALMIIFLTHMNMTKQEMHIAARMTSINQRPDRQLFCQMFNLIFPTSHNN